MALLDFLPPHRCGQSDWTSRSVCPHTGGPGTARKPGGGAGLPSGVRHCALTAFNNVFPPLTSLLEAGEEAQLPADSRLGARMPQGPLHFPFPAGNGMLILCDCFIYFIRFPWNVDVWPRPWLGGLLIYGSYKHSKVDMSVK